MTDSAAKEADAPVVFWIEADKTQAAPTDTTIVVISLMLDPAGRCSKKNKGDFSTPGLMNSNTGCSALGNIQSSGLVP